ncbi:MAG: transcription antitermination factor NusB [Phycisphaerales bacterium JB063]
MNERHLAQAPSTSARLWVARALTEPAERFPELDPPHLNPTGLSPADAALALAIYRTTIQRWYTLEHLLDNFLTQRMRRLEPAMQAVLLSSAAQLVFLDRLPDYAVVDQAVGIARKHVRAGASGMTNAVLRKLAKLIAGHDPDTPWTPSRNTLPLPGGGTLKLHSPVMPDPADAVGNLATATSMPRSLVKRWAEVFGMETTTALCLHAIENPPTVVAMEPGFEPTPDADAAWTPHTKPGFVVWHGKHEELVAFLDAHPMRRVQDTASAASCAATAGLKPRTILDYCAGRGTKSRQLALMHPDARVIATDTHPDRREQLRETAEGIANLEVITPDRAGDDRYDLVVLDVPCSNAGVLARRPEARYRHSQLAMGKLVTLQREIIDRAHPWVASGGHLLYCTCSIERPENRKQIDRLLRNTDGELITDGAILPSGTGDSYTDGSYHALVRL